LEYGLDSLVAVELRNWFAKNVQADVAIFDILGGSTIKALGATVASKSQFRRADWRD
jgi:aryl carrier-like protein